MKRGMMAAWIRTLIVQASWNYDRMVGIGVAHAMEPLLRDLPGGRGNGRYAGALRRVAGFFNAHPYLTGMAAGALARAEYDGVPEAQADRLRKALIGPLGSVGDQLIWAGWLPLSAAVGLIVTVAEWAPAGVIRFLVL
jgi:PTS system mannose-specific IID component